VGKWKWEEEEEPRRRGIVARSMYMSEPARVFFPIIERGVSVFFCGLLAFAHERASGIFFCLVLV
jgi:hypothetical protein